MLFGADYFGTTVLCTSLLLGTSSDCTSVVSTKQHLEYVSKTLSAVLTALRHVAESLAALIAAMSS